ncbi:PHP domain-containing protein [Fuerstiella marisgermanici]|uniref:Histidinol phosphatase of the PHP family protein n=1 Tax=Fuerstiella marisgermanici TaxID=1891926 RepID=A0A1P8WA21_9PLAN|nr:hypothetical protein [Fuerstiella marisgermanici]APZ90890.1 Histidinol phosphatase of the PHP family protein [Fuerstiella marisgermanici]
MRTNLILLGLSFLFLGTHAFGEDISLKADGDSKWYRGNMHTHSLWSDGDDYPEMIATWYREKGYDFLVVTDHNVLQRGERWIDVEKNKGGVKAFEKLTAAFSGNWVQTRTEKDRKQVRLKTFDEVFDRIAKPQEFLLIQGEEITDRYKNLPIHMCISNTNDLLPPLGGSSVLETMQQNVNAAISHRERTGQKALIHLNHPNFHYGITAEQLMNVVGENFFEVYNGHPSVHNSGDDTHASTERMWDIINTWRQSKLELPLMYGLATDDGHAYHVTEPGKGSQPGRGWVMVLADTLTPDAMILAIEAGRFYSSSGVTLDSVEISDGTLNVSIAAEEGITYRTDFIGTLKDFDDSSKPAIDDPDKADSMTRVYSDDVGTVLQSSEGTSASYKMTGKELYVRAVVTSSRKHPNPSEKGEFERAWVQPVTP